MGEIAEMMLDGTLDSETGEYLGKAVGYPRTRNNERKVTPYVSLQRWARKKFLGITDAVIDDLIIKYGKHASLTVGNAKSIANEVFQRQLSDKFFNWFCLEYRKSLLTP